MLPATASCDVAAVAVVADAVDGGSVVEVVEVVAVVVVGPTTDAVTRPVVSVVVAGERARDPRRAGPPRAPAVEPARSAAVLGCLGDRLV
ncbi:MAG TPA: hypothetical protein VMD59_15235 [Acidimicrobiales bacterium]|nr:hypothetical protein [Acidimicrobiales bacterium]